jgi:hypothetical protein
MEAADAPLNRPANDHLSDQCRLAFCETVAGRATNNAFP